MTAYTTNGMFDAGGNVTVDAKPKRVGNAKPAKAPESPQPDNPLSKVLQNFGIDYPNAPAPSPALLAFARGLGLNLSAAEDTKRRGVEQVQGRSADALDDLNRTSARGKKSLTADLMRRGVLASGESNTRYARHAEDKAAGQTDIARNKVEGISAIDTAFESSKGQFRTSLLERVLGHETDTATREAVAKANEDAMKREEAANELNWKRQQEQNDLNFKKQEELLKKYGA